MTSRHDPPSPPSAPPPPPSDIPIEFLPPEARAAAIDAQFSAHTSSNPPTPAPQSPPTPPPAARDTATSATPQALLANFRDAAARAARQHGLQLAPRQLTRPLKPRDAAYVGIGLTLLVLIVTLNGWLYVPDQWTYDLRTRFCQFGRPAPTQHLVHLDLDDRAIEEIGRWPWPRSVQALLLDELAAARPKAVALDILYDQPEAVSYRPRADGSFEAIDHDARFADALRSLGNVIIAYSHIDLDQSRPSDPVYGAVVSLLLREPLLTLDEVAQRFPADQRAAASEHYLSARREAVRLAVASFLAERDRTLEELTALIESGASLPGMSPPATSPAVAAAATRPTPQARPADTAVLADSPIRRLIRDAYAYETARRALLGFRAPAPSDVLDQLDNRPPQILPIPDFTRAAASAAFVTYNKGGDGIMRRVPLVMNVDGRAGLSLGAALAVRWLGTDYNDLRLTADALIIPIPGGGERVVPLRKYRFETLPRTTGGVLDLPWFGPAGANTWIAPYDPPDGPIRHTVSVSELWQSVQLRQRLAANNHSLRTAYLTLLGQTNADIESRPWDEHDPAAWVPLVQDLLDASADDLAALDADPPHEPPPPPPDASPAQLREHEDALTLFKFHRAALAARQLIPQIQALAHDADAARAQLRDKLEGQAVLVGWTATGRTDFVATPLHPACAGVRVHGLVFNAILSGSFIRFAPGWQTPLITLVAGLLSSAAVVRLSPAVAVALTALLAAGYIVLAATLFGYHGYIIALAPPLLALGLAWAGTSIARFVIERGERNRIVKRFQTYVDPQLVNYLLQNPERAGLAGEKRRMTVCFTDLAGFTTLSEKLGEQTVGMLNEYFALMVPLVRKHKGYVNKLLGDGMMFFFNAPQPNQCHAASAFDAVLEMQEVMKAFNAGLVTRGLPQLKMRVGITTGDMIAGDAGGGGYSDFTVLGDVVNLSSRLEGANKASGTLILCNRDARDDAGPSFLTRPVGMLRVVGKLEGIETFELMCRTEHASPAQRELARLTESMVLAYRRGDVDTATMVADQLDERFGGSKLTDLYRQLCDNLRLTGLPEGFDGTVVLESK